MITTSNRKGRKDVYDIDAISDRLSLKDLLAFLREKTEFCSRYEHKSLFDLDMETSPLDDLSKLLEFDEIDHTVMHAGHRIQTIPLLLFLEIRNGWRPRRAGTKK